MNLPFFNRQPKRTIDDELHDYNIDRQSSVKIRDAAMQAFILQPTDANKDRLDKIQKNLDIIEEVYNRLLTTKLNDMKRKEHKQKKLPNE